MKRFVVPFVLALGASFPLTQTDATGGVRRSDELAEAPTVEAVEWTNTTGVAAAPGRLTKTRETTAWDAGAVSTKALVSADGYVELVATEPGRAVIGLSHGDDGPGQADIDFGVRLSDTTLVVVEGGRARRRTALSPGDRIRVAVESGRVRYRKNGQLLFESRAEPTFPLLVDTSLCDRTSLGGVVIAGVLESVAAEAPAFVPAAGRSDAPLSVELSSPTLDAGIHYSLTEGDPTPDRPWVPSGGSVRVDQTAGLRARAYAEGLFASASRRAVYSIGSGRTTEPLEWTRLDGTEVVDGHLVKTRATEAWDSGAVSTRGILSEDGYVEFVLAERGRLVAGLSRGDRDPTDEDVDFGFLVTGGSLSVFEAGRVRADVGAVRPGDRLRTSVEAGIVRYWRNGVLLHESVAVPDYPLLFDTSIHHRASIGEAVISGVLVDLTLSAPRAEPSEGRYFTPQDVVLVAEPDVIVHYSLDGSEPDASSPSVPSGGSVRVDRSATLRAVALRDGWLPSAVSEASYELVAATPAAAPPPGAYGPPLAVTLATATPESEIRYTTDGGEPNEASALYVGPIPVTTTTTIRARAFRAGWTPSEVLSARYDVRQGVLMPPVLSPAPGRYTSAVVVTLTAEPGASIRYSTDGSDPIESSPEYTTPLAFTATSTLQARAFRPGFVPSSTASGLYEVQAAVPVFDPPGGTYLGARDVLITTATPGASIRYTTDGSAPTDSSPTLESGGTVPVSTTTSLKAVAWKDGLVSSDVTTAHYVILDELKPVLEPPGGTFTRSVQVRIVCPAPDVIVRYRTDGAVPTEVDPVAACGGTILVDHSLTLTAVAFLGDQAGDAVVGAYRIADGIAAGPTHLLLLRRDGTVWAWGENDAGQLGDGGFEPSPDAKPSLVSAAIQVAAGGKHSLAVKEDGTVRAWGEGAQGQLGNGATTGSPTPVPVSGLTDVVAIAAGESHSLALRSDGSVWAWGDNAQGQLGTGTTDGSVVPVRVADLSGVVEIAAGGRHSLARRNDGTVWAWGANDLGQLGLGTTEAGLRPTQVPELSGISSIAAGDQHSLAVSDDGALWGWGELNPDQVDNSVASPVLSPTRLGTTVCNDGSFFSPFEGARLAEGGARHSVAATGASLLAWELVSDQDSCRTTAMRSLVDDEVGRLSAAGRRYLAVTAAGTVWYWEDEDAGPMTPFAVTLPTGELRVFPPTLDVRSGTYGTELDVTVTAITPGSVIHYTTDGSEPDETSPTVASGASLRIDRSTVLQAIAVKAGRPSSAIRRAEYVLKVKPPVLTPAPSAFDRPVEVTLSVETPGAMLRVRTGGGSPQPGDPELPSGGKVTVTPPDFLQVEAFRDGWESTSAGGAYRVGVVTPVITPAGGVFEQPVTVTVTTTTPGAILRYSFDLGDPSFGQPIVSGGTLRIDRTATLQVVGFLQDYVGASDVAVATFRFALPAPTLHVRRALAPEGPAYVTGASTVTGAIVRCTIDGSEPHVRSPICNLPIPVDRTATVKARTYAAGWDPSPPTEKTVVVSGPVVLTPVFSLEGGRYPSRRAVRIEAPTPGATIHYTTSGADPTEGDPVIASGDSLVVDRSLTLKARAWLGDAASLVARADYLLTGAVSGDTTVLALKPDGTVWGWGDNSEGLVGNGTASPSPVTRPEPAAIDSVVSLAIGRSHAVVLREDGTVWTWGSNLYGQRGSDTVAWGPEPTSLTDVVAVAAGSDFGAALKSDRTLWLWGASYALPEAEWPSAYVPRQVPGVRCVEVFAEGTTVACINPAGETLQGYVYGSLDPAPELQGLLGLSFASPPLVGHGDRRGLVGGRFDLPLAHLAARNLLVADRGTAWGTSEYSLSWSEALNVLAEASPAVAIAPSSAVDSSGTLWRWGSNSSGQLGDGTTTPRVEPGEVPGFRLFSDPWFRQDADGDGLDNLTEHYLGTDPLNPDTNGDDVPDGVSVEIGRDPVSVDLDGDGLANPDEIRLGTGVLTRDSDGDGVVDGADAFPLDPSRSEPPEPNPGDTTPPDIQLREPRNAVLVSSIP